MKQGTGKKKETGKKLGKKGKIAIIIGSIVAVILIVAVVLPGVLFRGMAPTSASATETVTLKKADLTQAISVSGVVETAETTNIYSTLNYPVKEILVEVGDTVEAGDVIAVLDTESLQNDIAQAEINYDSARANATEEKRTLNDSVTNAENSLASAKITLEQREIAVANAEADLKKAQEDARKAFDSYTYDRAINDASVTLSRRRSELATALTDYNTARYNFDDYKYQNTITDAQIALDRKKADLADAQAKYNDAYNASYDSSDARDTAVENAQKALTTAQNAVDDAQRTLDRAKEDLIRAKDDATKTAKDKYDTANNALSDAQRAYDKAVQDKTRARSDDKDAKEAKVESAEKSLADAKKQLESAQNSVKSAENSLSQTKAKPGSSGTNVELQELTLDKLNSQLAQGEIVAEASGVITAVNVKVGATPQGVLFVIDNKDELYVSARVKEYNLNTLEIGQTILITTDATGDEMFSATLSYISPKAVSEAGSTSVEFEVRATLTDPDEDIKIGMNAFLNIITATIENVYAVPISAVVTNEKGSFVYAMPEGMPSGGGGRPGPGSRPGRPGETPERIEIPVTMGVKTSTSVEISGEGLKDGLQLFTDPEGKLSDGSESGGFPFGGGF